MTDPVRRLDRGAVLVEAGLLAAAGRPFVLATVTSVRRPASARVGDRGIVTEDGKLVGWVGGACSEPAVVREALRALGEGTTRLLRIGPPGGSQGGDGVVVAESSCASEGMVEVLIDPQLPQPLLAVVGDTPAAVTLRELAASIGWRVTTDVTADADAVVVATMGRGDAEALDVALATRAGYVGLVASAKRAGGELAALRKRGLDEDTLARVRSPAGLDLGPLTQPEIAVAVLAELVAWRHDRGPVGELPIEALDPVCGMTVAVTGDTRSLVHGGTTYWFCGEGCASSFSRDPARYLART
jgi:xanthine dehydrogenase accessory factor